MIEVQVGNATLEFPDGTPPEVIQQKSREVAEAQAPPIPEPGAPASAMTLGQPPPGTDIARAVMQGQTFNLADEIVGQIRGRLLGTDPQGETEIERAALERMPASTRIPAEIGGAVLSAGLIPPGANLLRGGPLAQGAQAGAISGTVSGAGAAEGGLPERALGAAVGAPMGAAAGVALPLASQGLRAGLRFLSGGRLAAAGVPPASTGAPSGLEQRAAGRISRAMGQDLGPGFEARAVAREAALGPQATALDVGGENVRGLLRGAAGQPGAARELTERVLSRRQAGQQARVVNAARNALGASRRFGDTVDEVIEARAAAAKPVYDQAFREQPAGGLQSSRIDDLLENNTTIRRLVRSVRGEDPDLTGLPDTSLEVLDEVYKELGARSAALRDRLNPQRSGSAAHRLDKLRRTLRDAIVDEVSTYGRALETYSHDSNLLDALMSGRNVLRQEDYMTRQTVRNLSNAEREMWLIGVAEGIQDLVERVQNPRDVTKRILGNRQVQNRIRAAIPDRRAWRQFQRELLREGEMAEAAIAARPTTGSQTALRQTELADLIDPIRQIVRTTTVFGPVAGGAQAGGRLLTNIFRGRGQDQLNEEIARQLLSPVSEGQGIMSRIQQQNMARRLAAQRAAQAATAAGNVAGGNANEILSDLLRRR